MIINILYIIIQDWLRNILFDIWSTEEICRQTSFWFYLLSCSCHISHFLYLFYESFCYLMIQVSFTYREKSTQKGFHTFLYWYNFVRNIPYYQSLVTALYFWKFALKVKKTIKMNYFWVCSSMLDIDNFDYVLEEILFPQLSMVIEWLNMA